MDIEIKLEDVQEVLKDNVLSHLTPLAIEMVKVVALKRKLKEFTDVQGKEPNIPYDTPS